MPDSTCDHCARPFVSRTYAKDKPPTRFCSQACYFADRRARAAKVACCICGEPAKYVRSALCNSHYIAWRDGWVEHPTMDRNTPDCSVDECTRPVRSRGLCSMHWQRTNNGRPVGPARPYTTDEYAEIKRKQDWYRDANGYVYTSRKGKKIMQHRLVKEQELGRQLLPNENVHHINGVRDDNSPKNLELWTKSQPSGQRVADKVAWAIEFLEFYAPEVLSAKPAQLRLA